MFGLFFRTLKISDVSTILREFKKVQSVTRNVTHVIIDDRGIIKLLNNKLFLFAAYSLRMIKLRLQRRAGNIIKVIQEAYHHEEYGRNY